MIPVIGKVTTESVFKGTGKHWQKWVELLDKAGARSWTHAEIVAYLKKKYRLGPWWQQGVTLGFELAIGRRIEGHNAKGQYTTTITRSFATTTGRLWMYLVSPAGQNIWLQPLSPVTIQAGAQFETKDGFFGEVRTLLKNRRLRLIWQDPNWDKRTVVQITLVARPNGKAMLVVDHQQIVSARIKTELHARWRAAADALPVQQGK